MNKEPEFNIWNIWFGTLVPLSIFNIILAVICDMFINLGIILVGIMAILYIKSFIILYKEMRIWAKVT